MSTYHRLGMHSDDGGKLSGRDRLQLKRLAAMRSAEQKLSPVHPRQLGNTCQRRRFAQQCCHLEIGRGCVPSKCGWFGDEIKKPFLRPLECINDAASGKIDEKDGEL